MKTNKILHSIVGLSLAGNVALGFAVNSYVEQKGSLEVETLALKKEISLQEKTIAEKELSIKEFEALVAQASNDIAKANKENEELKGKVKSLESTVSKLKTEVQPSVSSTSKFNVKYTANSNVGGVSGVSAAQLNKAFKGTGLDGLGGAFVSAEKNYGVNAIFLSAIAVEESGWGKSGHARSRNNLFGIASGAVGFGSKQESIDYTARLLANNYLKPSGKYYNGATPAGVNVYYCEGSQWRHNIAAVMNTIVKRINQ